MPDPIPRLVPDAPLPPYSYVPGRYPHPIRDPAGHSFGHAPARAVPLDPERWSDSRDYLVGVDLFNHGYYWEAHEVWEGLWHAAGRTGPTASLVQGLIKLAAAGVKVRQGMPSGTAGLAQGAALHFRTVAEQLGGPSHYLGLAFADLATFAQQAEWCASDCSDDEPGVLVVFPFVLRPVLQPDPGVS